MFLEMSFVEVFVKSLTNNWSVPLIRSQFIEKNVTNDMSGTL